MATPSEWLPAAVSVDVLVCENMMRPREILVCVHPTMNAEVGESVVYEAQVVNELIGICSVGD